MSATSRHLYDLEVAAYALANGYRVAEVADASGGRAWTWWPEGHPDDGITVPAPDALYDIPALDDELRRRIERARAAGRRMDAPGGYGDKRMPITINERARGR